MQSAKCLAQGICALLDSSYPASSTYYMTINSDCSSSGSSNSSFNMSRNRLCPRHMLLQLDLLQFPIQFILRGDQGGPVIRPLTHSRSPPGNRTAPVRWTYSLNSHTRNDPKCFTVRSTRSNGRHLSGQTPSRPSSILSPSFKFLSISPSLVHTGAKPDKSNHSSS